MERLTEEERREIDEKRHTVVCQCGHLLNEHCRFLAGLFTACQCCDCKEFRWQEEMA